MTIALFVFRIFAGKIGRTVADSFSYKKFDYNNVYAWISVHHIVQMLIALAIILVLSKLLKVDFGFKLGDIKEGKKYLKLDWAISCIFPNMMLIITFMAIQTTEETSTLSAESV
jgi:hypothetical protein